MFAPKRILVPTDFSIYSDEAVKEAVDIAKHYKSKIYLLHVLENLLQCPEIYCIESSLIEQAEKQGKRFAEEKMREEIATMGAAEGIEVVYDIKEGHVVKTILEEQEDQAIDLIVIATRGHYGPFDGLGSVSEKVLRGAKCTVMLIR